MAREAEYGQLFARVLRSQGALVYSNVAGEYGVVGWPDKHVWHSKWDGLVELKGPDTVTRGIQKHTLRELDKRRPRHAVQVRFDGGATLTPRTPVTVTQYSVLGDADVVRCTLEDLLERLSTWSKNDHADAAEQTRAPRRDTAAD